MASCFSALIVGFGYAGQRFARICREARVGDAAIKLAFVVDLRPETQEALTDTTVGFSVSLEDAFARRSYEVVFVCTNDNTHFDVLLALAPYRDRFRMVVCEKPLTNTLAQAEIIRGKYENKTLIVNFNERHSRSVTALRGFLSERGLAIARGAFFWGKNRVHDPRPTMGIFSEMSHPIDLMNYIADLKGADFRLLNATSTASPFSCVAQPVVDTVEATFAFANGLIVSGSSSYLWPQRDRRLVVYLGQTPAQTRYVAALRFDHPLWDDDSLEIWCLSEAPGRLTPVEFACPEPDVRHAGRKGVEKTFCLVESLIGELQGRRCEQVARLEDAVFVQRIFHAIESREGGHHAWSGHYARPASSPAPGALTDAGAEGSQRVSPSR